MKAILLAAGKGTRLSPQTEDLPKCLLKIKDKTILEYILDRIVENNIQEIVIVIGFCGDKIRGIIGNTYKGFPVTYVFNPVFDRTNSIYSLWLAENVVGDSFVVINADTLFSKRILQHLSESPYEIALATDDTLIGEISEEAMKVTIINGVIKDVSKQIPPERAHGVAIGLYKFGPKGKTKLYKELKRLVDSKILDQLFTKAVKNLIMNDLEVFPISTKGLSWIDIDTYNDLKIGEKIVEKMLEENNRKE
ncbi:MAG: phosphocholine cytidylyltransferase family protein [Methanocellales archaeon]|nr:phosphocholine cytidylyltransferase family protein [Methanocellales archaeon]MDD3291863.1 phosphocholine cytidylyltransferase family protein [Methanocellales archaeon]MDD5235506.1 phosphocholine cytidylyltransferase family protein [Methanocellales archaeon]MDD5485125.1 phosphocholine cytidylyltransferase family protein [Methanocellales archaeon]